MNFSRRNATQPLPPAPLAIWTLAISRNFIASFQGKVAREAAKARSREGLAIPRTPAANLCGFAALRESFLAVSCGFPLREAFAGQRHDVTIHCVAAGQAIALLGPGRRAAELGQNPPGSGVVVEPAGHQAVDLELAEAESRQPARAFRGIALPPIRLAQPIAELEMPRLAQMHAASAQQRAVGFARDREIEIRAPGAAFGRLGDVSL